MSDTETSPYVQQGFMGPRDAVDAARTALADDVRVFGMVPAPGLPPLTVVLDPDGAFSFGIAVRQAIEVPAGLRQLADGATGLAMQGSSF